MPYNKFKSLGTVSGANIIPGEVIARKVQGNKYIVFRLTYENKPRVIGLTVPTTLKELVFHRYLTKEEARRLR
jgi:hypothetical protein